MPTDPSFPLTESKRRHVRHTALFASVSAATLLMAISPLFARALNGGGAGAVSAPNLASDAAAQAAQQAAAAARHTQDSLARAARAVQDMQNVQSAARAAAAAAQMSATSPVAVPNGLGPRGLLPKAPENWTGAKGPTQSVDGSGQTQVNIQQAKPQAILDWRSFNVGARTTLTFDQQGNRNWVALNRVDREAGPSQIFGQIKADGQVYVINQSGIIFGGASQVNVGSLIASTAKMSNGLSNGIYSSGAVSNWQPIFTDAAALLGNGKGGGVVRVEAGAQIATHVPGGVTSGGGFVLLMGGEVTNAGTITTPLGQTQLAAGDAFVLRRGYGTDTNQFSTTRGNEIAVGTWNGTTFTPGGAGQVRNEGLIVSPQGDITLAGRTITQDGILLASTSVNTRGTIHLLNSARETQGSITLGAKSFTTVIPELESTETALNSQRDGLIAASGINALAIGAFDNLSQLADRLDQSRIEIVTGGDVVFHGGSLTAAKGGQVSVSAGKRIFTETSAIVDVSGVRDVALAMSSNNVLVNVQGNELRDSPQNRESDILKNNDVWIDLRHLTLVPDGTGGYDGDRYYTKGGLLEVGGYIANTTHTIGEWSALGGTITLSTPDAVIAQQGSLFDISGGSLAYAAGWIRSTNLIGSNGRRYSVDNARGDMTFAGFAGGFKRTHNIQGQEDKRLTEIWTSVFDRGRTSLRWEDAYTVGRDAGQLILSTPTAIFEGDILADIVTGKGQTNRRAAGTTDGYKLSQTTVAQAGSIALGQYDARGRVGVYNTDVRISDIEDITAGLSAQDVLPDGRTNTLWLDAGHLNDQKLGGIDVATGGKVTIDSDLKLADGGTLNLIAPVIDFSADVTAHSGRIITTNVFSGPTTSVLNIGGASSVTVRNGTTLDLSGLWVNARLNRDDYLKSAYVDGGSIRLESTGDVTLESGSLVDVSSGAAIMTNGSIKGGRGGNVALIADRVVSSDPQIGVLTLDGAIRAYGVNGAGTLTIESGAGISIGGSILRNNGELAAGEEAPIDLRSLEEFTVREGEILPADYHYEKSFALPGEAIGGKPAFSADNPVMVMVDWKTPQNKAAGQSYVLTIIDELGVQRSVTVNPGGNNPPTIRAGSVIIGISPQSNRNPPFDYVVPADVFPNGIPIAPIPQVLAAGNLAPNDVVFAAGTTIAAGRVLAQSVAVAPLLNLETSLFRSGFANYDITGRQGLAVVPGTQLNVETPVYRLAQNAFSAPTGAKASSALDVWTPPVYLEDPVAGTLDQRTGGDLSLRSDGQIVVGTGSIVGVDPGHAINITGRGTKEITIDGTLNAWGGSIFIDALTWLDTQGISHSRSIWIGDNAVLDVAGRAVTAQDQRGRTYGFVQDGGTIAIGGGLDWEESGEASATDLFVVIRPGAIVDASGASAVLDLPTRNGLTHSSWPLAVASNGGSIVLKSNAGLYLDGTIRAAAGGAGAAGGTLALALETPVYTTIAGRRVVDDGVRLPREFVIAQQQGGSVLSDGLSPRDSDPMLRYGMARLGADKIEAGGFDNLAILSTGLISFDGDVTLQMAQSLRLYGYAYALTEASAANASVSLAAPYVRLAGATRHGTGATSEVFPAIRHTMAGLSQQATDATFAVNADLIDIRDQVGFGARGAVGGLTIDRRGFKTVDLVSRGDMRFLQNDGPTADEPTFPKGTLQAPTQLAAPGDLTITAAQVYPATGVFARVQAKNTLTIQRSGPTPAMPWSVFGTLVLDGNVVNQGGVVRAPGGMVQVGANASQTNLLPGSITSASLDGLLLPYGGTTDGLSWLYNGERISFDSIAAAGVDVLTSGVTLGGASVDVRSGAIIDLQGGGELLGAGFVSGRGGSIDILKYALADANPALGYSRSGNRVYAIVPNFGRGYAPVSPEAGGGNPAVGQQITIPAGVPGLPAGTYTLLPSTYALLPGAFRVELGGIGNPILAGAHAAGNGSYIANGYLGVANTAIRDSLPTQIILSAADTVRTHSLYNETTYSQFATARAAELGWARPLLPMDGRPLALRFTPGATSMDKPLRFAGTALFEGSEGGSAGYVTIAGTNDGSNIEILGAGSAQTAGYISLSDTAITAIDAPRLVIGAGLFGSQLSDEGLPGNLIAVRANANNVVVRSGAVLSAGEVILAARAAGNIIVETGAEITTLGRGATAFDATDGYIFEPTLTPNILAVSNGMLEFLPPPDMGGAGGINIGGCLSSGCSGETKLYSEGSIAIVSSENINVGSNVRYGARNLQLSVSAVNIGTTASLEDALATGILPGGLSFNQDIFDRLLAGNQGAGIPKLESLTLTARESVNFFGSVDLSTIDPATGQSTLTQLVLNTPAIYGHGGIDDVATLSTDTLVWSGIFNKSAIANTPATSVPPGAVIPGGAGTGRSTLNLVANVIELGYGDRTRPDNQVTLDRLALGFSNVNLTAAQRIGGNNKGSLAVYQAKAGTDTYSGGNLNLTTPLLTGAAGSVLSITAGGTLNVMAPSGANLAASNSDALGATLNLKGGTINVDSAVVLPSGRLTLTAASDIVLTDRARIDMSGRAVEMFDVTQYSWGGDVAIESLGGNVTQAAGSVIDLSAENNAAGSLSVMALADAAGHVNLAGTIRGTTTGQYNAGGGALLHWLSGGVDIRGQTIADFVGLNQRLTAGGIFGERSFQLKQGDLVIGDEVKANLVDISVDGGSLTVHGTINAGGERVGTIRLAARDGLTLGANSVLDTHGTVLRVDSDGDAIDAPNRAAVELTSKSGRVTLQSGAAIDLRAADTVTRGTLTINAPRLTETGGDISIDAGGTYDIRGARSIAVNGFWTYSPTDADGSIVQDNGGSAPVAADGSVGLNQINQRSQTFMTAALGNGDLLSRLSGLRSYEDAFHLRPGVEIASATPSGKLTVKGDLDLSGYRYDSLNPHSQRTSIYGSGEPGALVIRAGSDLDIKGSINDGFAPPPATPEDNAGWVINESILVANVPTPRTIVFNAPFNSQFNGYYYLFPGYDLSKPPTDPSYPRVVQGGITDGSGAHYGPGAIIPGYLSGQITIEAGTIVTANDPSTVNIVINGPDPGHQLWAIAPMLAPGSLSWDIRLGAGADLRAANQRAVQTANKLNGRGNLTLSDMHTVAGTDRPIFSVIRTGTGDLDIFAGGNFSQDSLYGIYTAGTQSSAIDGNGNVVNQGASNPYNLPRGLTNGKVLGTSYPAYDGAIAASNYQARYPELGGNLSIQVGGDLTGSIVGVRPGSAGTGTVSSSYVGNWLWTQGDADAGIKTAWWINFGAYALLTSGTTKPLLLPGFSGFGTFGGGNIRIDVDGDAGVLASRGSLSAPASQGLNIAIGSTGRVLDSGSVVKTGGGDLVLNIAGVLNPLHPRNNASSISTSNTVIPMLNDLNGVVTNLRGSVDVLAGAMGRIDLSYGSATTNDPRAPELFTANAALSSGGLTFMQGDANFNLATRSDLVVGGFGDPGRINERLNIASGSRRSSFPLYTPGTTLNALSAGGNLTPFSISTSGWGDAGPSNSEVLQGIAMLAPPVIGMAALSGSAYFHALYRSANLQTQFLAGMLLFPSQVGQFDLLVAQSIYGASGAIDMSGANPQTAYGSLTNPLVNTVYNSIADTVTSNLHAGNSDPIRIFAVAGDIVDLSSGQRIARSSGGNPFFQTIAAKPVWMRAGRDLVNVSGLALNNDADDVSMLSAGRDIIYANFQIAGPGLLDVSAGRNIYQADQGQIISIGALAVGDTRPGASILMQAGVGAHAPDYAALAALYLEPGNLADPAQPLADQPGKVVKTYEQEMVDWLEERFSFVGTADEARAYFDGLDAGQQNIFLRTVYFAELKAGGREYNDASSPRFGNYIRGRNAIAVLFPEEDANGYVTERAGNITMFSTRSGSAVKDGSVRTLAGGDIQMLAPGGQIIVGVEGVLPGPDAGVITQFGGSIQMYSQGSFLLGLSRIMTNFGDDILAWSNTGDINAGRGAKTTIGYAPPLRRQDDFGNVSLVPSPPRTGAGISARSALPGVQSGDVDLIAPLGTVDIGEAGVSGFNVNIAALHIVNAANISAQGNVTGVPTVQAPSIATALTTSNATAATQQATVPNQGSGNERPSVIIVEVLGYGGGEDSAPDDSQRRPRGRQSSSYDPSASVEVLGNGPDLAERARNLSDDDRRQINSRLGTP